MAVVLLAAAGFFVSLYLTLYELGYYGGLVCGAGGSCARVQASDYAVFLGIPVAGWGVAWYTAVAATGLWSLHRSGGAGPAGGGGSAPSEGGSAGDWPGRILFVLAAAGLAFSAYLTALEAFVIEAWCRWCLASAALTVLIFALSWPERRAFTR